MTKQKQQTHKLNIFSVLGNLSKGDVGFYAKLTDDEKKSLQPLVVMRWLTGTSDARQIYFLNELVNPFVFSLTNHKELLVDLMAVSSSKQFKKYTWEKAAVRRGSKTPIAISVIQDYFNYSTKNAADALPILETASIIEYAEQLGKQPEVIKQLKKELKDR